MFIGRKEELKRLDAAYASASQEVVLVYGRRRVGKSELIREFLKFHEKESLYYECKETSEENNLQSLASLFSDLYHYPPLAFQNLEQFLDFYFQQSITEKRILVLDEYPYLRQAVKGLDSILQSLIDKYRGRSHLKLILCGSFIDVMKSLLESGNPLYGRITLTLHVRQMDYYESSLFYPNFSPEDKVRLYSVFGGIPYYNALIDSEKSVRENIITLLASPGARLENEVALYLSGEISKLTNANEVFNTLAAGYSHYKDILAQSHVSSSPMLAVVLTKLIQMEIVEKEVPINDPGNKKKAGYRICDNLSDFYYRYLFRYASQLRVMNPETFYDRFISDDFESQYVPKKFETVCREFLIRENRRGALAEPFDAIGKYWYDMPKEHKNGEFDIVTHDRLGYIFYEAKFRREPVSASMIQNEIQQVQHSGLACYRYGFFSRSGFDVDSTVKDKKVQLYTLADLFSGT